MKKKILSFLIIGVLVIGLIGCGNTLANKSLESAKSFIEKKEYDKALLSLEMALDEDEDNEEANKLYSIVDKYKKAKNLLEENNIDEAKKSLDEISNDYINYEIKDDVDLLKQQIEDKIEEIQLINNKLSELLTLIDENKYDEANVLVEEINNASLNDEQKTKVSELKTRIDDEVAEIEAQKKAEEEARLAEEARKLAEEKVAKEEKEINRPIELSEVIDYVSNYTRDSESVVSVLRAGEKVQGYEISSIFNIPSTEMNDYFYIVLTNYGEKIEEGFVVNIRNRSLYNSYGEKVN